MQYFGILGELTFPQYILYMYIEVCVQNIVQYIEMKYKKCLLQDVIPNLFCKKNRQGISQHKDYVTKNTS